MSNSKKHIKKERKQIVRKYTSQSNTQNKKEERSERSQSKGGTNKDKSVSKAKKQKKNDQHQIKNNTDSNHKKKNIEREAEDFGDLESAFDSSASMTNMTATQKSIKIEYMITFSFVPYGCNNFTILILVVGICYVCALFVMTMVRYPNQSSLNIELQNSLINADYFSWQIYGFVYYQLHLEMLRNLREGLIPKDAFKDRLYMTNYYLNVTGLIRDGAGLSYLPDKLIDQNYATLNFTGLIRIDEWYEAKLTVSR